MVLNMWDETGVEMGCGVTLNFVYFTDNRYLLDMAERFPQRINPIVVLSATDPATPAALKAMAKAYGVSGVRFSGSPDASNKYEFLSAAASAAWEMANELQLAVVLLVVRPPEAQAAALPAAMKRVAELADKYPNVNIVLDHVGFPIAAKTPTFGFSPEHLALAGRKNVFFKYTTFIMAQYQTTGVPLNEFLTYAVGIYGADQFVWGSAFGNNEIGRRGQFVGGDAMRNPEGYRQIVKLALDSADGLTLAQKKAVFYSTAKRAFVPGGRAARRGGAK
jgi:predicted TIM-barrel fold metal-dependent hydrolase